jgi:hypothetical protein
MSNLPNYKLHDPLGWCGNPNRGAAMGRGSWHAEDKAAYTGKLHIRRIRLSGDYDCNGTYFGGGYGCSPLYWCASPDNTIDFMFRAKDRFGACQQVRAQYPNAKIVREVK